MPKPFVVGIAGGSASGKTTYCNKLKEALHDCKITTFHMDQYFKPVNERPFVKAPISVNSYMDDNHPETLYLSKLRDDLSAAINSGISEVVIIEGLLVLSDEEINSMLDLKLFIDCRADERIVRRLNRNMKRGLTFEEIADVYLDMVRYRHDEYVEPSKWKADFILNGSHFSEKAFEVIVSTIRSNAVR